jgi:Cu/Zn superoxide dismutase
MVMGWVEFHQVGKFGSYTGKTRVEGHFTNIDDGEGDHGFHVHEIGSTDCSAAGSHYNPDGMMIGESLNDLDVSDSGRALYYEWNDVIDLYGDYSVMGRAVVVHALDGTRIACGVIEPGCSPCREEDCLGNGVW